MTINKKSIKDWLYYLELNKPEAKIDLGLKRIKLIADNLGLLDINMPVITIAGTNGKGSTVAVLEAIYTTAGYRVGSYTSPHISRFNERIRVNNQMISDENLCNAFAAIDDPSLTYFEMATLAALWHFKHSSLDLIILEVGLGGRLDATNIVDADLAIITTIALDHQSYLGDTIEKIGFEKAGILRENRPFIYADINPPNSIIRRSTELNSHMLQLDKDFSYQDENLELVIDYFDNKSIKLPKPKINPKAVASSIVAVELMSSKLPVLNSSICNAMGRISISGRQQVIKDTSTTVLDVAHNHQAVCELASFISVNTGLKIYAVFSALQDKDLYGLINPLAPLVDFWYTAPLNSTRAAPVEVIEGYINQLTGKKVCVFNDPAEAYKAAHKRATKDDIIIVYGSFLTVSSVLNIRCQEDINEICNG